MTAKQAAEAAKKKLAGKRSYAQSTLSWKRGSPAKTPKPVENKLEELEKKLAEVQMLLQKTEQEKSAEISRREEAEAAAARAQ